MSFLRASGFCTLALCAFFLAGCSSKESFFRPSPTPAQAGTGIINTPNMHRATMRSYTINGKTYQPTQVSVGDYFSGIASWYGKDFHGKKTSNGEIYNMYDMTAAHKTFPMNTMLKVTHLKNNKSIVVRVNDRGPFVGTRVIDLSYTAATRLDMMAQGTGPVGIEVIGFAGVIAPAGKEKESVIIGDYFVQIGAFRNKEGAARFAKTHQNLQQRYSAVVKEGIFENQPIYRVWLRGFGSVDEAEDFMAKGQFKGSFIVKE